LTVSSLLFGQVIMRLDTIHKLMFIIHQFMFLLGLFFT
jgi:hypothetical protein